ncbi:MAG: MFS transporter [Alphaproteobacteria bacterium]|nr:MFS transporter [Alphaproteobacteria bacterium]
MKNRVPLLFLCVGHFLHHYAMMIFPTAVLAIHREWGAGYGETLALGTASFVALGLGTLPAGWLGDRVPRSRLMLVYFLALGVAAILAGFATGPVTMMAALALLGLFAAIYHPVGIAAIVQLADGSGRVLAVNGVFGNWGFAGAVLVTGVVSELYGWRWAFIAPGIASVLLGLAATLFMGRSVDIVKKPALKQGAEAVAHRGAQIRVFVFVACGAIFGGFIFNGVTAALPKLFEDQLGDAWGGDLAQIGMMAAMVFAIASLAQLPVGILLDRIGARPIALTLLALQAPLLYLTGQAFGPALVGVSLAALLLIFGEIPVTDWLIGRYVSGPWQSRVLAVSYVGALGVSAAVLPVIAVLYETTSGFGTIFALLAASAAVVWIAAVWLPRKRHSV